MVDTFNPLAYKRMDNWESYQNKLKQIYHENQVIYRVIMSAVNIIYLKVFYILKFLKNLAQLLCCKKFKRRVEHNS